jgi:hypothetical protein
MERFKKHFDDYNGTNSYSDPCPDQYVGIVRYMNSFTFESDNGDFNRINLNESFEPKHDFCIIVVLESPHIREYDRKTKTAIGPANGMTGANIRQFIGFSLGGITLPTVTSKFDLLLVNAIQYQTSLGFSPSRYRDLIFLDLWRMDCTRDGFNKRLENYISRYCNGIIINCCTQIGKNREVKDAISRIITTIISKPKRQFILAEAPHPSSCWYRRRKAKVVKW